MSSVDIQIVSGPNLEKIESFLNDSTYRETIEYSANFNTRLCIERRLRLPFLDPQTGVAQNHCSLYMSRRQRMPGFREGQIYTYPATRWRKSRRQYLAKMFRPFSGLRRADCAPVPPPDDGGDFNGTLLEESSSLGGADTSDSKDSQNLKEELPKDWFYDDMDMNDLDQLDEPKSPDDEYDYDPRYGNKKRKRREKKAKPGRKPMTALHSDAPRKGRPPGGGVAGGARRGRRKNLVPAATMGTGSGATSGGRLVEVPSPPTIEPPSFESAAAAVATTPRDAGSPNSELRSYRKYL
ncbi:zinc finger protein ubi-d4 [Phlebotomus argentipes]|uniref:zinc finger protein ubi-d4 n=1 Tax=Phlebotomus argentipes TaxID=94469 RepID=UPI002893749A|nr:zinc finger protein ubi-d4 [Phlebotomus argentipes]